MEIGHMDRVLIKTRVKPWLQFINIFCGQIFLNLVINFFYQVVTVAELVTLIHSYIVHEQITLRNEYDILFQ